MAQLSSSTQLSEETVGTQICKYLVAKTRQIWEQWLLVGVTDDIGIG